MHRRQSGQEGKIKTLLPTDRDYFLTRNNSVQTGTSMSPPLKEIKSMKQLNRKKNQSQDIQMVMRENQPSINISLDKKCSEINTGQIQLNRDHETHDEDVESDHNDYALIIRSDADIIENQKQNLRLLANKQISQDLQIKQSEENEYPIYLNINPNPERPKKSKLPKDIDANDNMNYSEMLMT